MNEGVHHFLACERKDVSLELVQILLGRNYASIHLVGGYDECLPLHQLLLSLHPSSAKVADHQGCTPLHLACRNGAKMVHHLKLCPNS